MTTKTPATTKAKRYRYETVYVFNTKEARDMKGHLKRLPPIPREVALLLLNSTKTKIKVVER